MKLRNELPLKEAEQFSLIFFVELKNVEEKKMQKNAFIVLTTLIIL